MNETVTKKWLNGFIHVNIIQQTMREENCYKTYCCGNSCRSAVFPKLNPMYVKQNTNMNGKKTQLSWLEI